MQGKFACIFYNLDSGLNISGFYYVYMQWSDDTLEGQSCLINYRLSSNPQRRLLYSNVNEGEFTFFGGR
ncbi:hypothetical protein BC938DRAFT_479582 [Jimgerdemannia flammicorona]|uniref:Uncharacterized protein n=1 Tax=Jimgerdemannia flammicorona TaxID=994334 RepID=A0A433QKJ0_9FUNG|nr:hypothetical protein BC938DRAFT_479582 [Jimgerdemannia flammicorona]